MKVPHKGLDIKIYIATGVLTALAVFTFPNTTSQTVAQEVVATPLPSVTKPIPTPQIPVEKPNPFASIPLSAKAAYVVDVTTGKMLFGKNENEKLPLASITKIMMAVTALEMDEATSTVIINDEALKTLGDTGLLGNESWDLKDLLRYTLVVSSNDGAAAIASSVGIDREEYINQMNKNAEKLGLSQMWFHNETGLDESSDVAGGYGTAKEVSILLTYAYQQHKDVIGETRNPDVSISSLDEFIHTGKNTNILASSIPRLKAGKTGYSYLAGGNLAILFSTKNNHDIAVIVLGSGYDERFGDVDALVNAVITANE